MKLVADIRFFLGKQVFCNLYFISAMFNEIESQSNKTCVKNLETGTNSKRDLK